MIKSYGGDTTFYLFCFISCHFPHSFAGCKHEYTYSTKLDAEFIVDF